MTKFWCKALLLLVPTVSWAQESGGIDQAINNFVSPATAFISSIIFYPVTIAGYTLPLIVVWLVIAATFFTLYFGFINIRGMGHGFRLIRGDYSDPSADGEVSHFQALATAVSGTVGLGNIAGVALAVSIGGPGATFWMIMAGFLGMSSKFTECTLGVLYRNQLPDGSVSGGPMYYLSKGLAEKNSSLAGLGRVLAIMFAIFCIGGALGGGNMFQANQSFQQLVTVTGGADSFFADKGWLYGLVVAILVGVVIIGGIRSIARVTEKLVPFMAVIYILCGLIIILSNAGEIPGAFVAIFKGAFSPEATYGGVIGVLIVGFQRAAFSNEAGVGSAAIAHSAVKTDHPATEGLVALYEPFLDTVVICTITALVIIITGTLDPTATEGVELTSRAFASVFSWFPYVLSLAVILFAFSTMLAWSYYGMKAWTYLLGEGKSKEIAFKLMFMLFVVIGASMNLGAVVGFSDAMIFAMSFPNIIGLYFLIPVVKRELKSFLSKVESGEIASRR